MDTRDAKETAMADDEKYDVYERCFVMSMTWMVRVVIVLAAAAILYLFSGARQKESEIGALREDVVRLEIRVRALEEGSK